MYVNLTLSVYETQLAQQHCIENIIFSLICYVPIQILKMYSNVTKFNKLH